MPTKRSIAFSIAALSLTACSFGGAPLSKPSQAIVDANTIQSGYALAQSEHLLGQPPKSRHAGWIAPAARSGKNVLYVADLVGSTVWIFPNKGKNPKPVGQLTDGVSTPSAVAVDQKLNVYVANANTGAGATITVYAPGTTSPSKTLSGAGIFVTGMAIANDGTIYIADGGSASLNDLGQLIEYPPNTVTPAKLVPFFGAYGVTVDKSGNVFASQFVTKGAGPIAGSLVYKFAPNLKSGRNLHLKGIASVGGLGVDQTGNILVVDQGLPGVLIYPSGSKTFTKKIAGYFFGATDIAIGHGDRDVYVSSVAYQHNAVYTLKYPGGSKPIGTIANSFKSAWNLAVSPIQ